MALLTALALPAWAGRVPTIQDQYQEEMREPEIRDPNRRHLPALTNFLYSHITDQGQQEVPSIDYYIKGLDEVLYKGSDRPRYEILKNAEKARNELRDGYDDLRKVIEPLREAHRLINEIGEILVPAVLGEVDDSGRIREAATSIKTAADPIETDPPKADGPDPDAQGVASIEPRKDDLEPIEEKLAEAAKRVKEAKPWAEKAKARAKTVELLGKKAKEMEEIVADQLGQGRTRGFKRDINLPFNSAKVIENTNKWLIMASKLALKAIEELEKQTTPDKGLGKVNKLAKASDGKNMFGKSADERSAQKVTAAIKAVGGQIKQEWEQADQMEEPQRTEKKREAVDKATQQKTGADDAAKRAEDAAEKAEEGARAANDELEKAVPGLKKLKDMLGPEPPEDQLTDIMDVLLRSPEPRPGPRAPTQGGGPKQAKSKGLKYPKVLDVEGSKVLDEYGEGEYGSLRGQ